jgi:WD40 repeat protein
MKGSESLWLVVIWLTILGPTAGRCEPQPATKSLRTDSYGDSLPDGARVRFGTVRWQARGTNLAFSPDGRTILACDRFEVSTIDATTGKRLARTKLGTSAAGPSNNILVAFSSDRATVATLEPGPGKVRLWEVSSGKLIREISVSIRRPLTFAWSPNGKLFAATNTQGSFYVWDAATGKKRASGSGLGQGSWLDFSPDSKLLAIAVFEQFIRIWDISQDKMIRELELHPGAMGFHPAGKWFTCLVENKEKRNEIKLWDTATWKEAPSIQPGVEGPVLGFDATADMQLLAIHGLEKIFLWSVPEHEVLHTIPASGYSWYEFSPDFKRLACSNYCTISLWDVATGRELNPRPGHASAVDHVVLSPDGKILCSTGGRQGLMLWDTSTGNLLRSVKAPDICGCPSFSADGKLLVTGDSQAIVRLWSLASGKELVRFSPSDANATDRDITLECRLSTNMKRVGAISHEYSTDPARLYIWDATNGKRLVESQLPACSEACLSPDCELVALAELIRPNGR